MMQSQRADFVWTLCFAREESVKLLCISFPPELRQTLCLDLNPDFFLRNHMLEAEALGWAMCWAAWETWGGKKRAEAYSAHRKPKPPLSLRDWVLFQLHAGYRS